MFQVQPSRFSSMSSLPLKFLLNFVIVPLYRGTIQLQFSGDHRFAGYAWVLPQIGGNLCLHLQDQLLQLLLTLLTGLGIDIPGVLFPSGHTGEYIALQVSWNIDQTRNFRSPCAYHLLPSRTSIGVHVVHLSFIEYLFFVFVPAGERLYFQG